MFIVFGEQDGYTCNINHLGNELAFRRGCLCASRLAHGAYVDSGGMMSTAGLELPYPWVFQAKFRNETSPGGQSRDVCERGCIGNINHLW